MQQRRLSRWQPSSSLSLSHTCKLYSKDTQTLFRSTFALSQLQEERQREMGSRWRVHRREKRRATEEEGLCKRRDELQQRRLGREAGVEWRGMKAGTRDARVLCTFNLCIPRETFTPGMTVKGRKGRGNPQSFPSYFLPCFPLCFLAALL